MIPPLAPFRKILSLCDYSGAWSKPYADAGYDVICVDLQRDGRDVRLLEREDGVHGILAAPPCTCFASSGARWPRSDADMIDALSIVDACIRLVWVCRPVWWALENPVGKLVRYLGKPRMYFNPCDFGDPYTKRRAFGAILRRPVPFPSFPRWETRQLRSWAESRSRPRTQGRKRQRALPWRSSLPIHKEQKKMADEAVRHMRVSGHAFECERIGNALVFLGDCFEVLPYLAEHELKEHGADLLVTDPPYGVTACSWDCKFDLDAWWRLINGVCKENAAQCVFCQMPFAAELYACNKAHFRYDLIFCKLQPVGHLNANRMPLRIHELIYVFYRKLPVYNVQYRRGAVYAKNAINAPDDSCYRGKQRTDAINLGWRSPVSIVEAASVRLFESGAHNTQKDLSVLTFLVRSYSNRGELVLDPFMGSASTGVAALCCGRRFIGIEKERRFFDTACKRLEDALRFGDDMAVDAFSERVREIIAAGKAGKKIVIPPLV